VAVLARKIWRTGSQGGAKPPEAEALLVIGRSMEAANLFSFITFENAEKSDICVFCKKSWVAMKLRGPGAKLGGLCSPRA